MTNHPLKGRRIVITRPKHQSDLFAKKLQKVGGCPFFFPLIEITPLDDEKTKQKLLSLESYDLVIFVSANAAQQCLKLVGSNILKDKTLVSIGKKSAQVLSYHKLVVDFCPDKFFNSEALLSIDEFKRQAVNKKIAIIRGSAGRDYLKNNLIAVGATVDYMDVYTRHCPQQNIVALKKAHEQEKLDCMVLTSASSTASFFDLVDDLSSNDSWLNDMNILIGSERMQHEIPSQFKGNILIADDPSDETIFERLTVEFS